MYTNTILVLLMNMISINCLYRHKIEPFSFDIQKFEYPLEWNKVGTTVALKDTIKLIPKVEDRYGGLFMSQPAETDQFEMIYSVVINNNKNSITKKADHGIEIDDIEGLVLWYLNTQPSIGDYRSSFGYRGDYTGLGLYVFKH